MKQKYTIYKHTSPSGKQYIGQTSCDPVQKRWMPNPETKYRTSVKLRNAIRKYGWHTFLTEVLAETTSKDRANKLEVEFIRKFDSVRLGYNLQSGGKNFRHSDETKQKIGDGNRGKIRSIEFRQKISNRQKQKMTPEYRKILSIRSSGWNHTDEAKKKIGLASLGNKNCLGRVQPLGERQLRSLSARNVLPLPCGHKRHNRYSKCIIKLDEIQNDNNNTSSFEDQVS